MKDVIVGTYIDNGKLKVRRSSDPKDRPVVADLDLTVPVSYMAKREHTSPRWCSSFSKGCGGRIQAGAVIMPGAIAMFGSRQLWSVLEQARREGRDWYYGDHGYFGRFVYFRVTKNAFQHTGRGKADPSRFLAFNIPIKDWRKTGSHILLCPPDPHWSKLMGIDYDGWRVNTLAAIQKYTDRPVVIRERTVRGRPLADDLQDCWAMVTYMSNAAVESVLAGVPVFCLGQCAGLTMGSADLSRIEKPRMPRGRLQWASVLAANQWTLSEMADGLCWRSIR